MSENFEFFRIAGRRRAFGDEVEPRQPSRDARDVVLHGGDIAGCCAGRVSMMRQESSGAGLVPVTLTKNEDRWGCVDISLKLLHPKERTWNRRYWWGVCLPNSPYSSGLLVLAYLGADSFAEHCGERTISAL